MAYVVKPDLIKGARATYENGQLKSATTIYSIHDVTGITSSTAMQAYCLSLPEIPADGSNYPTDATVYLRNREWSSDNRLDGGVITCTYAQRSFGQTGDTDQNLFLSVGSRIATQETHFDILGHPIVCPNPSTVSDNSKKNLPQNTSVTANFAEDVKYIRKLVTTPYPGQVTRLYRNKINSVPYEGDPKWTWYCEDARADLYATGEGNLYQWIMDFTLIYRERSWLPVVSYWDDEENRVDSRVVYTLQGDEFTYDGAKRIQVYDTVDFNLIHSLT